MQTLRIGSARSTYKRSYYKDSINRESGILELPAQKPSARLNGQYPISDSGMLNRNSISWTAEGELGPDYHFLYSEPIPSSNERAPESLVTLTDLASEVATLDNTLENNLLFTQYVHEDSELFDVLYPYDETNTFGLEIFGDLGVDIDFSDMDAQNEVDKSMGVPSNDATNTKSEADPRIVLDHDADDSISLLWPDIPCDGSDCVNDSFNSCHKYEPNYVKTADQSLILFSNNMIMVGSDTKYRLTSKINQYVESGINFVGMKRNLE